MNKIYTFLGVLVIIMSVSCTSSNGDSDAFGNIETNDITISSEVSGKLLELTIDEGYSVEINQLIGVIDTVPQILKLKQLTAQLSAAYARLQGIKAQIAVHDEQVAVLNKELERTKKLYADSAATLRQLDDIVGKYSIAAKQRATFDAQLAGVMAEIEAVRAQTEQANDLLLRCKIISPISGTIVSRYVNAGELVVAGNPICRIAPIDTVLARVYFDEAQLSAIKIGDRVKVLADKRDKSFVEADGTIAWISAEAEFTPKVIQTRKERVSLVYAVKVRIPNADGTFKIGMPVEVKLLR